MASARPSFAPGLVLSLCVVPLVAALLGLGVWQLVRGEEKERLQALQLDRVSALPILPPAPLVDTEVDTDFLRVRIRGSFEAQRYFLVDNQVVNGRAGYWVVQGFRAADGRRWLVNRGWVDGGARRDVSPTVNQPTDAMELVGVIWPDFGLVPMLTEELWDAGWPKRVPRMNTLRMAEELGAEPVEVRLEVGQRGRLGPLSLSVAMDAPRHRGYAVQWFGLALILVAGYVLHGYRPGAGPGAGSARG